VAGRGAKTATICELIAQGDGRYDPIVTTANAHLIAAAPDLLAALKQLHEACYHADCLEELPERIDGSLLDKAKAAIDKAEGMSRHRAL
jgi:hypothetical protein